MDYLEGLAGKFGYGAVSETPFGRAVNHLVDDTAAQTKDQFGHLRKAGAILKGSPVGTLLTELIFPEPMADGTLDAAIEKGVLTKHARGY